MEDAIDCDVSSTQSVISKIKLRYFIYDVILDT